MKAEEAGAPPTELDDAAAAALLPERSPRSHKGSHGTLVCIAGSLEYTGAALLAALAAARAGTGLVALAVPADLQPVVAGRVPEVVVLGLPDDGTGDISVEGALAKIDARQPSALLAGPGLRETDGELSVIRALLSRSPLPTVLDGGALNLLAGAGEWWKQTHGKCVLTPHPGEFARLTGRAVGDDDDERAASCAEAARRFGQVVVLKGARTVVAAPDGRLATAPFENPALAGAGTGDVLAGTVGGLLAQGLDTWNAACLGVYLHGMAGDRLRERLGDAGVLASDLPIEIALARRRLAEVRGPRQAAVGFARR